MRAVLQFLVWMFLASLFIYGFGHHWSNHALIGLGVMWIIVDNTVVANMNEDRDDK